MKYRRYRSRSCSHLSRQNSQYNRRTHKRRRSNSSNRHRRNRYSRSYSRQCSYKEIDSHHKHKRYHQSISYSRSRSRTIPRYTNHHSRRYDNDDNRRHYIRRASGSSDYHRRKRHPKHDSRRYQSRSASSSSSSHHSRDSSSESRDDTVGHYTGGTGDMIASKFEVIREVGLGTFGRVLECRDITSGSIAAIKVVRNIKKYTESAKIEADILQQVNQDSRCRISHVVQLWDRFSFSGYYCMVFEPLGKSLYDCLKQNRYNGFPIYYVKEFLRQIIEAIAFIHSLQLTHTDLKPENILLVRNEMRNIKNQKGVEISVPRSIEVKVIDFGGATFENEHKSSIINTRQYRAPEVVLELEWDMSSDLWCVGSIASELYHGELLFATHSNMEHLALIERCIGCFPAKMLAKSKIADEFFHKNGLSRWRESCSSESQSHIRKMKTLKEIADRHDDFEDFLRNLLKIDPKIRCTAEDALKLPFFSNINDMNNNNSNRNFDHNAMRSTSVSISTTNLCTYSNSP